MTATRWGRPFTPVNSSGPGMLCEVTATSVRYALESTTLNRTWQQPSNRAVRLACSTADDYYVNFGSSTVMCESTNGMLILGGSVETFFLAPAQTYIAFAGATGFNVSVTLGYGF